MAVQFKINVDITPRWWLRPVFWLGLALLRVGRFFVELSANHGHRVSVHGQSKR